MNDYEPLNALTDAEQFKDDPDALWLFATALLAASLRGALQHLPGADALALACANMRTEIEKVNI